MIYHMNKHMSSHMVNENINENINRDISKNDIIDLIVLEFKKAYEKSSGLEYELTAPGKERSMAGKILRLYKNKNPDADSGQTVDDLRKYFDMCVAIDDSWLQENMSLAIIVSQFNKINKILRHGKQRKGASDGEIAEILARHFGSDSPAGK